MPRSLDDELPDPDPSAPVRHPARPITVTPSRKIGPAAAKQLNPARTESVVGLKVKDWVRFTSPEYGPEGVFRVSELKEDGCVLIHEDGSSWSADPAALVRVRSGNLPKLNLGAGPAEEVSLGVLEELGFQRAPAEDFVGAGEKTYFKEVKNGSGYVTVIYDLQPPRGRGQPAIHAYYTTEDGSVAAGAACFTAAKTTVGQLREVLELAAKAAPKNSSDERGLRTIAEFTDRLKIWTTG